jgi:hypothetical protein
VIRRASIAAGVAALATAQPALAGDAERSAAKLGWAWDPAPTVLVGAGLTLLFLLAVALVTLPLVLGALGGLVGLAFATSGDGAG